MFTIRPPKVTTEMCILNLSATGCVLVQQRTNTNGGEFDGQGVHVVPPRGDGVTRLGTVLPATATFGMEIIHHRFFTFGLFRLAIIRQRGDRAKLALRQVRVTQQRRTLVTIAEKVGISGDRPIHVHRNLLGMTKVETVHKSFDLMEARVAVRLDRNVHVEVVRDIEDAGEAVV